VAREAGVSKATLYAHFTSKEQLFAEMIGVACRRHAEKLTLPHAGSEDIRLSLTRFGREVLGVILSPGGLAVYRVVIAEAPRFPELGRSFYGAGPGMLIDRLGAYFAEATAQGLLATPEPRVAAMQFLGMIRTELALRHQLCLGEPAPSDVERNIAAAVDVILRAYAPR
jgi:AcrR family transcriptional regulator